MKNLIEEIQGVVQPPEFPINSGSLGWFTDIETELSLELPLDYKELTVTYGEGTWQGFWYLLNPFTDNPYLNLLTQASREGDSGKDALSAERNLRKTEDAYPHRIWPEPGGIFPWGITDNGGRFFWLTSGNPDSWPTVYYPSRDPEFTRYELSTSEIVFGALTSKLPIFAEEFGGDVVPPDFQLFAPPIG